MEDMMRFPTISDVAAELRRINKQDSDDGGIDVRLQVHPDGTWTVNWGPSDYDQDHRGYWGSSSVPGDNRRFDSKDIARDLIDQAREHKATGGGDDDISESPARGRVAASKNPKTKEFAEFLDKAVILVAGESSGHIDPHAEEVHVAIVVNVTGYGPHVGAIYVDQNRFHASPDGALEEAYELLEEWERDHYPEADEDTRTETFDGRTWTLPALEFTEAIYNTKAEQFVDILDEEDEPDEPDDDEDLEEEEYE